MTTLAEKEGVRLACSSVAILAREFASMQARDAGGVPDLTKKWPTGRLFHQNTVIPFGRSRASQSTGSEIAT
jgi:hypothetical protein